MNILHDPTHICTKQPHDAAKAATIKIDKMAITVEIIAASRQKASIPNGISISGGSRVTNSNAIRSMIEARHLAKRLHTMKPQLLTSPRCSSQTI